MRMLSISISSWPVCSGYASVPGAYAQHFLKGMCSVHALVPDAYAQCTHQFLIRMLSVRISSWCACSVQASVPDAHAQRTHQFLTRMLRVYKMNILKRETDAHAEHARKELMRALSMRLRNCSGCASGTAQGANFAHSSGQLHANQGFIRIRIGSGSGLDPDPGWQIKNYPQK